MSVAPAQSRALLGGGRDVHLELDDLGLFSDVIFLKLFRGKKEKEEEKEEEEAEGIQKKTQKTF